MNNGKRKASSYFLLIYLPVVIGFSSNKLPPVNQKVINYVNSVLDTQVGNGECWDFTVSAQYYSKSSNSIIVKESKALPGDFISFRNVILEDKSSQTVLVNHHAIIYTVTDKGLFIVAHQNHNSKRKVHLSQMDINSKIQGDIFITRRK